MAKKAYTETQIGILADTFGKSCQTIRRWVTQNNDLLTSDKAKAALQSGKSIISNTKK